MATPTENETTPITIEQFRGWLESLPQDVPLPKHERHIAGASLQCPIERYAYANKLVDEDTLFLVGPNDVFVMRGMDMSRRTVNPAWMHDFIFTVDNLADKESPVTWDSITPAVALNVLKEIEEKPV